MATHNLAVLPSVFPCSIEREWELNRRWEALTMHEAFDKCLWWQRAQPLMCTPYCRRLPHTCPPRAIAPGPSAPPLSSSASTTTTFHRATVWQTARSPRVRTPRTSAQLRPQVGHTGTVGHRWALDGRWEVEGPCHALLGNQRCWGGAWPSRKGASASFALWACRCSWKAHQQDIVALVERPLLPRMQDSIGMVGPCTHKCLFTAPCGPMPRLPPPICAGPRGTMTAPPQPLVVTVRAEDGSGRSTKFSACTAAELLPAVALEFGTGSVCDPHGVVLTTGSGALEEGEYTWHRKLDGELLLTAWRTVLVGVVEAGDEERQRCVSSCRTAGGCCCGVPALPA